MLCRANQDGWVMVEGSDKLWSIGEGIGKPLQYSCLENPVNSMKRPKDMKLKDKLPTMSEEEQYELLASDGMLVKRPIIVNGDQILVGFKAETWEAALK